MMISYDEALSIILAARPASALATEAVALADAPGRVCAEAVKAEIENQPFDNSAMDGFAVRTADIASGFPVKLVSLGQAVAGNAAPSKGLLSGQCWEIMTGAPVPAGADAVVPVEMVTRAGNDICFTAPAAAGDNIRRAGQDIHKGQVLLKSGTRITPAHLLALATVGTAKVSVFRRPKIGVISTGLEVVDVLSQKLEQGQIYNSTGPYLRAMLPVLGAEVVSYGTVRDDPAAYGGLLKRAVKDGCDIILSTGAVSAGAHDFVRTVLEAQDAKILFHKLKMRPGKPLLFARMPDNGPLFFGLPGNPMATACGLRFFVVPVLRQMQGQAAEKPATALIAGRPAQGKTGFRFFLRARLRARPEEAVLEAEILQGQQSFMVASFLEASGWAVLTEDKEQADIGEKIMYYPFLPVDLDQGLHPPDQ